MAPAELAKSIHPKTTNLPTQIIDPDSPSSEFPLVKFLIVTGVLIGVVYIGHEIYDYHQKKKLE
ncbi:MAG: hypothetical protein ABF257_01940 [Polaribacter sp.]